MEDVLAVYDRPYDEKYPVLCMDEKLIRFFVDFRKAKNSKNGTTYEDYAYIRNGTAYSYEEIKKYVLLDDNDSSYKQKINETYRLLDFAYKCGNKWISNCSMRDVRVAFRETFISKCPYKKDKL